MNTLHADLISKLCDFITDIRPLSCVNWQFLIVCGGLADWVYWRNQDVANVIPKLSNIVPYCYDDYCKVGNLQMVKYHANKTTSRLSIYIAARYGQLKVLKYLVKHHIYLKNDRVLIVAVTYGQLETVKYLAKYLVKKGVRIQQYSLNRAMFFGHMDIMRYLVESGSVDINVYGHITLLEAVQMVCLDAVKYLIECGVDARAVNLNTCPRVVSNYLKSLL